MCSLKVEWGDSDMGNFVEWTVWQHILQIICILCILNLSGGLHALQGLTVPTAVISFLCRANVCTIPIIFIRLEITDGRSNIPIVNIKY